MEPILMPVLFGLLGVLGFYFSFTSLVGMLVCLSTRKQTPSWLGVSDSITYAVGAMFLLLASPILVIVSWETLTEVLGVGG